MADTTLKYTQNNIPIQCMMTQSSCYQRTRTMDICGILWHSTGANNTNISRYVQPDDNATDRSALLKIIGTNKYKNDWNHITVEAGLNAWIGKLADGTVGTVQTMPWNFRPWGCGSGKKGSCNSGWIQFEICEDGLTNETYFNQVYEEACQLTAYLCKLYNIDPKGTHTLNGITVPNILCHKDSADLQLGSNHGDIYHWFNKYNKSMVTAREDVATLLNAKESTNAVLSATKIDLSSLAVGDIITLSSDATYTNGQKVPNWVLKSTLYTRSIGKDTIVFSVLKTGAVTGTISKEFITEFKAQQSVNSFTAYQAQITASVLNIRASASTSARVVGSVRKGGVYTIVAEQNNFGKLKSGAGWISLDYIKKI